MTQEAVAVLGGGCFWCLEPVFDQLVGVLSVTPGYAGGHVPNPSYRAVCSGTTGHAEVVRITFHPEEISFRTLLEVFFAVHDPTTPNRQGADVGEQYRSVVFCQSEEQRETAEAVVGALAREPWWEGARVVTDIQGAAPFYLAEDDHLDYYRKNPGAGYCRVIIDPKLSKFKKRFQDRLKTAESRRP